MDVLPWQRYPVGDPYFTMSVEHAEHHRHVRRAGGKKRGCVVCGLETQELLGRIGLLD